MLYAVIKIVLRRVTEKWKSGSSIKDRMVVRKNALDTNKTSVPRLYWISEKSDPKISKELQVPKNISSEKKGGTSHGDTLLRAGSELKIWKDVTPPVNDSAGIK